MSGFAFYSLEFHLQKETRKTLKKSDLFIAKTIVSVACYLIIINILSF